jgi:CheY-like chemotaxis protein
MNKIALVLLVDDDYTTNFVNQLLLEDMQVVEKVLLAQNGKEGLEMIRKVCEESLCPTLILLDINMPVMNGFEFLEAYEKLEFAHKQSVVIVMLTTSLNPNDIDRLQKVPIKGFLNKPLTEAMVHEIVHKHFQSEIPT